MLGSLVSKLYNLSCIYKYYAIDPEAFWLRTVSWQRLVNNVLFAVHSLYKLTARVDEPYMTELQKASDVIRKLKISKWGEI